jgi:ammonium transporter, Amt family
VTAATFAVSMVLMLATKYTVGLRVSRDGELEGLDLHEHGGGAYPELVGSSHGFAMAEPAVGGSPARAIVPSPAT